MVSIEINFVCDDAKCIERHSACAHGDNALATDTLSMVVLAESAARKRGWYIERGRNYNLITLCPGCCAKRSEARLIEKQPENVPSKVERTVGQLIIGDGEFLPCDKRVIRDANGILIARTGDTTTIPIKQQEANAAHLARCWNCHDELVAVCEKLRLALNPLLAKLDLDDSNLLRVKILAIRNEAVTLIAKAREH